MTDPFTAAPQPVDVGSDQNNNTLEVAKAKKEVKPSSEDKRMTITLKGGSGYDAPWVVLYADSVAEGNELLGDSGLKELLDRVKQVGSYFGGGDSKPPAKSSGGYQKKQYSTQPGQPEGAVKPSPEDEAKCPGPGWKFTTGVSKTGRTWKAWWPPKELAHLDPVWC